MRFRLLLTCLLIFVCVSGRAEDFPSEKMMETVFRLMPDSVIPSLSENNKLDMIDFVNSNMKAEITNLFGGKSEMLSLTDDSLCIRVSDGLTVRMLILRPMEVTDDDEFVICLVQTFGIDTLNLSTKIDFMTLDWQKLDYTPRFSEKDEHRIQSLNLQTILNWEGEVLKKD